MEKGSSYQYWPVSLLLVVIFSLQHFWIANIKSNHEPFVNHTMLIDIDSFKHVISQKELDIFMNTYIKENEDTILLNRKLKKS